MHLQIIFFKPFMNRTSPQQILICKWEPLKYSAAAVADVACYHIPGITSYISCVTSSIHWTIIFPFFETHDWYNAQFLVYPTQCIVIYWTLCFLTYPTLYSNIRRYANLPDIVFWHIKHCILTHQTLLLLTYPTLNIQVSWKVPLCR